MHPLWRAWWAMFLAVLVNIVAMFAYRPAQWVTIPLALFACLHYFRVAQRERGR
jgi:hypothetical protein